MVPNWLRKLTKTISLRTAQRSAKQQRLGRSSLRAVALEDRLAPAVTSVLVGNFAAVSSDAAADVISITQSGGLLALNGSFDWDTATPGDQTLAAAAASTISLDTGAGADTVNVGSAITSAASTNLATISYVDGGASDSLNVFDNLNPSANTFTYTSFGLDATGINIDVGTLITGGRFLTTGSAGDTVNIESTAAGENCTVNSAGGVDTVTVGTLASGVSGINSQVEVQNNPNSTVLIIEDSIDASSDTVDISVSGGFVNIAGITDSGALIRYDPVDVADVTINLGTGADRVNASPVDESLSINFGGGSDELHLVAAGSAGSLSVNGAGSGAWDWTSFGQITYTSLDSITTDGSISVPIVVAGTSGDDRLRLSRPGAGTNLRVSAAGVTWIQATFADVGTIQMNGGLGNDTFEIDQNIDQIVAKAITINGDGGTDSLIMTGQLTGASSGVYNIGAADPNGFSGQVIHTDSTAQVCTVNFTGLEPVEDLTVAATYAVNGSTGNDTINIINGPLSTTSDPVTGNPELTVEVNFNGAAELVRFRNKTTVTVDGKAGVDTMTLNLNVAGTGLTNLTVDSGDGDDVVRVQATGASFATTVTNSVSSGGNVLTDTVTISDSLGTVQSILGTVSVTNPPARTSLLVDNSGDTVARIATLSATSITGLAPAAINWIGDDLEALNIAGGSGGNTYTVTGTPSSGSTSLVTIINSGSGADVVNVQATDGTNGANLVIAGNSGADTVNIGSIAPALGGTLANIAGAIQVTNAAGFTTLVIDDSGDAIARTATIDTVSLAGVVHGRVTGLGNSGAIQYSIGSVGEIDGVTIHGGSGGNQYTINQAGAGTHAYTTTLNAGTAADIVTVQATSANVTYAIDGQNGADTVKVASATNTLTDINGLVRITNPGATSSVTIDASGDTTGRNATLDQVLIGAQTFGQLTGLGNSAAIQYSMADSQDVDAVTISGGSGGNTITVNQTTAATGAGFTTELNTGSGTDVVNLKASAEKVLYVINGNAGADSVNVGSLAPATNGTLADIKGIVQIQNTSGKSIVTIDDSGDTTARTGTLFSTKIALQTFGELSNFGNPAAIRWAIGATHDVDSVTINGGSGGNTLTINQGGATGNSSVTLNSGTGNDTVNVQATSDLISYFIEGQNGTDVVNIGGTAPTLGGTLADIKGAVRITNGTGVTALDVDDSGDAVAHTVTIDTITVGAQVFGQIAGLGNTAAIQYAIGSPLDVNSVTVRGGSGGNTYTIVQTGAEAGSSFTLRMGTGSDTVTVTPDANMTFNIFGDTVAPPTLPGDTLNLTLTGTAGAKLTSSTSGSGIAGSYTFSNREDVIFQEIETLGTAGTDVSISVTDGQTTAVPGAKVTYTIVVINNGPLVADTSNVTTTLPGILTGVTFTAAQAGGATGFTANGTGSINDNLFLPIGASVTYTLSGTINPSATGTIDVKADVASPAGNTDPIPANNTATDSNTLTPQADLAIVMTDDPDPVLTGKNITYTITVTNLGLSDATNLVLTDLVPNNTTFVSFSAPAGWATNTPAVGGTGSVTATRATFAANGAAQVFTLVVRVNNNTPNKSLINNTATISSSTADTVPINNSASTSTEVKSNQLPLVTGAGAGGGPQVIVYDSTTGQMKFSFYAYDPSFTGGVRVAAGDVTGDGIADILTAAGTGGGPHVKVFDGVTGAEIRSFFAYDASFTGGVFIAAGDLDGDGLCEIITGADAGGGPHVRVFNPTTLQEVRSFYAYSEFFAGGVRVASGDVNGDGRSDIITGAGPSGGPHVIAYSGLDNSILQSFMAFDPAFSGGVYVGAGDMNNDGDSEIIVGAGAGGSPHVLVYEGTNLAILASFSAYDPTFLGGVRVSVADVNADGQLDLLTGAGPSAGPHVKAYDGLSQNLLKSFYAYDPAFQGGVFVG